MEIPFTGQAYTLRSLNAAAQRCVNLYPEVVDDSTTPKKLILMNTPGLLLFANIGAAPMRGGHVLNNILYAVSGSILYSITTNGTETALGTLSTSSGRVSMADNGTQVCIVDGANGYIYNTGTATFTKISAAGFPGGDMVIFLDGYFIVNKPNTGSFQISGLYDGLTWNALDIATAEGEPDKLLAIINSHRELWLIGEYTTEVWWNSGNASFPFQRMNSVFIEKGTAAKWSVVKLDNSIFWLAQDTQGKGYVVRANGYSPQVISTRAIEAQIATYSDISDAIAFGYTQEGHTFYVLTFPSGNATWVYDVTTGLWHERQSYGVGRHRGDFYVFFNGKHLVGDFLDGDIYEMKLDTYTDNGDPIERIRRTQATNKEQKNIFYNRLQVDMETGVGNSSLGAQVSYLADGSYLANGSITASGGTGDIHSGADPKAILRWSDDGGSTWGNEHITSIGKIGKFKTRAVWNRLGRSRNRVYELKITDPVKTVILGAYAEVTVGRN